jgi:hypothetical protein
MVKHIGLKDALIRPRGAAFQGGSVELGGATRARH